MGARDAVIIETAAKVYLVMSLLITQTYGLEVVWGWQCESGNCVKKDATQEPNLTTFNMCKLTCDPTNILWPFPSNITEMGKQVSLFLPDNIAFEPSCQDQTVCNLLEEAFQIFKVNLDHYHPHYLEGNTPWNGPWNTQIEEHILYLNVKVAGTQTSLDLTTDESYEMSVTTSEDVTTATITAPTFFGARHAIETLSQLVEYHETAGALMIVTASMSDSPVFPYRGVLLDTSRNYLSVGTIQRTLDAMAANKLNTLHWHITDTHSFPLVIDSLPNMASYGAYSSSEVYTVQQISALKEYARVRGVRLLPELDAPAHVGNGWQWGEKEGLGRLAVCVNQEPWRDYCLEPPCGQLNFANPAMYDILSQVYEEIVELFSPLDLFHFGGDEVNLNCWNSTDEIYTWMNNNNYGVDAAAYYKQWGVFQSKARDLLINATKGKEVQGILFTSALTSPEYIETYLNSSQYVIQIWTDKHDPVIGELLNRGYRVIFSNYDAWYLDCGVGAWVEDGNNWCSPYKEWQKVYDNSPYGIAFNQTGSQHRDLVMGGEAALWTEQADDAVVDAKLWPRCAALAERLWTNPSHNWISAQTAFIHHRQRLVKRGIEADRIQPQWCHQNEGSCY